MSIATNWHLQGTRVADNPVELIEDKILTAAAASVTLVVPRGYGILFLHFDELYGDRAAAAQTVTIQFNSDTGANYDTSLQGFGAASSTTNANTGLWVGYCGHTDTNEYYLAAHFVIFNRAGYEKVLIGTSARYAQAAGSADDLTGFHVEGKWRTTTEISSIQVSGAGGNLTAPTRIILMGVKI